MEREIVTLEMTSGNLKSGADADHERTMAILDVVRTQPGSTMGDIAHKTGIPQARLERLLPMMIDDGDLELIMYKKTGKQKIRTYRVKA